MLFNFLFQYQPQTEPVYTGPEVVTESRWHEPWSEPVRQKIAPALAIALAASGLFYCPQTITEVITPDKWFAPLSDPVRIKPGLLASLQQTLALGEANPEVSFSWFAPGNFTEPVRFKLGLPAQEQQVFAFSPFPVVSFSWFNELSKPRTLQRAGLPVTEQQTFAFNPRPFVSFGWFGNLSDPVRVKPGLRASLQQFFTTDPTVIPASKFVEWFNWLSEPVRLPIGLKAHLQQVLAWPPRLMPTPNITATMSVLETKDTFLGAEVVFNLPTSGELGVQVQSQSPGELGLSGQPAPVSAKMSIRII
jgi:hypothetical protein